MSEVNLVESWMSIRDHFPVASTSMIVASFGVSVVFLLYRFRAKILKEINDTTLALIERFKK